MADTAVQFTSTDASFLADCLRYMTGPLTVDASALAEHMGKSPGAVGKHVQRIRIKYQLDIWSKGVKSANTSSPQRRQKRLAIRATPSDSDLPEFDEILRRARATSTGSGSTDRRIATVSAYDSPKKRRRGADTRSPRRSKKPKHPSASSKQSQSICVEDGFLSDGGDMDFVDE